MALLKKFFSQTRKPEGVLGRMMLAGMNAGHAKLADWGMSFLPESLSPLHIAELGCGAGRNAGVLMDKFKSAKLTALDYSALSVEKAREYNKDRIRSGRCVVVQGDVSELKLEAEQYDLATAFETVYFWPGLVKCFSQVYGILKEGGYFLICNESDGNDETGKRFENIIDGMKCHTADEMEAALIRAGFSTVHCEHHPENSWIAVVARKERT